MIKSQMEKLLSLLKANRLTKLPVFFFTLLMWVSCDSNTKNQNTNELVANKDSIINAAVEEAAYQASQRDSIFSFKMSHPINYKKEREFEIDYKDGQLVVPEGNFWEIHSMLVFADEQNTNEPVPKNSCVSKPDTINVGDFNHQRIIIKYITICIGNRSFYEEDLNAYLKEENTLKQRFSIRRFGIPSGTMVCIPPPYKGNISSNISFEVVEWTNINFKNADTLINSKPQPDPNDTNCYL